MYIRQIKKQRSKDAKVFYQYTLAQTLRVEGKVKQRAILYLGSSPLLQDKANRKAVLEILKAKIFGNIALFPQDVTPEIESLGMSLYEKYCIKYDKGELTNVASTPSKASESQYHNVNIKGLENTDVKTIGAEHLCKQVLDKLEFGKQLKVLGFSEKQIQKALISIAARAIFSASEYKTSQLLKDNSELQQLFDYQKKITHKQLYSIADKLYSNKEKLDSFLYKGICNLFNLQDSLVIFDISNTYFETSKPDSKLTKYARSKEKRSDCPLVVFTGVINKEGFIRHSRIYQGNTSDSTTMDDMLKDLEAHSGTSKDKTIVIDPGIATDENLKLIASKGYRYLAVSRTRLKEYPKDLLQSLVRKSTDRDTQHVKLGLFNPEGYTDNWMYVQSESKRKKETAMSNKLCQSIEQELQALHDGLAKKGTTKHIEKVWERIGRIKERNRNVSGRYTIEVAGNNGKATAITWQKKTTPQQQQDKQEGVYFIRTNHTTKDATELWDIYNTIREVEATFRCLKSDLNIRPVHHQKDHRIEAHIYLTLLAYQLVNTIRYMLKQKGIHHDWKNIVRLLNTHTIQTIIIPTDKKEIHLRKPAKPINKVMDIYKATNTTHIQTPIKKYVVYH